MSDLEPLSEARIAAYLRGDVTADERAAIEIAIDRDPQWLAVVAMMARLETPLPSHAVSRGAEAATPTGLGATVDRDAAGLLARERDARLAPGTQLGRYRVEAPLGRGAMGMVYAALDPELDRRVALKLLHHSAHAQARMVREAHALARVQDPRVLAVLDVGVWHDRVFVATELLRGVTLHEWRLRGTPRWQDVVDVYIEAARGLAAAHARGVIHRDFKPANVMRTDDGRVVVVDFGLAEFDDGDTNRDDDDDPHRERTASNRVIGTPAFMAPEQREGRPCGPAADQFAVCVALWAALHGSYPPTAHHPDAKVGHAAAHGRVPLALRRALERGLARDPDARHASMSALVTALEHARGVPGRRWRWWAAAAIAVPTVAWVGVAGDRDDARCGGGEHALADAYSPDRSAALGRALAATDLAEADARGHALTAALDDYAHQWRDAYAFACTTAGTDDPGDAVLLDARMACLDRRRLAMSSLIEALESSPREIPSEAVDAVAALPSVAACRASPPNSTAEPWPRSVSAEPDLEAIVVDLAHVRALRELGWYADATPMMDDALARADALGAPDTIAQVRIDAATLASELGRRHEARMHFEVAQSAAVTAGDDLAAATASVRLGALLGEDLGLLPEAQVQLDRAAAILQRIDASVGPADELAVELARARGQHALAAGDPVAARAWLLEALAMVDAQPDGGIGREEIELLHNALGNTAMQLGELELAAHEFERAATLLRARLGPAHPNVVRAQTQQASILRMQGDAAGACALLEDGLTTLDQAPAPSSLATAETLVNLSVCELDLGREAAALEHLGRAEALVLRDGADAGPLLAKVLALRGDALIGAGRSAEAVGVLARALASYDEIYAEAHPARAEVLSNLGVAWNELGNYDEAARWQLRAIDELTGALGREHPEVAFVLTSLAQTRALQGRHREALELAREAAAIAPPPFQPYARARVGEELAATGALDEGAVWMEQALADFAEVDMDPGLVAAVEWSLAQTQWSRGRHGDARAAAERAIEGYERSDDRPRADEVRAWLGAHAAAVR